MDDCKKGWSNGECCCNCKNHLEDFYHCTSSPKPTDYDEDNHRCVCSEHKGWICYINTQDGARASSGWGEHGYCEFYIKKEN